MDNIERQTYAALGALPKQQRKFKQAIALIQDTYIPNQSHVAFSCGKDSSVVLHLALQVAADIPALFCSTEQKQYLDDYNSVIKNWQLREKANIKEIMLTPYNWQPNKTIKEIINAPIDDVCYLGLRKSESKARRITLNKLGLNYDYANGGKRVCPIANWTTQDVWSYIAYYDLPTLGFYDSLNKTHAHSRTSVFLGTGHAGNDLAVESRFHATAYSYQFYEWEQENYDIRTLMKCYSLIKDLPIIGEACYNKLSSLGQPVPARRIEQFETLKQVSSFREAKAKYPYFSLAAWALFSKIYGVQTHETIDQIIDQLSP